MRVARFTLMASTVGSEFGDLSAPGTGNVLTGTSLSSFESSMPRLRSQRVRKFPRGARSRMRRSAFWQSMVAST
jgi:hypothetical protein